MKMLAIIAAILIYFSFAMQDALCRITYPTNQTGQAEVSVNVPATETETVHQKLAAAEKQPAVVIKG